jgi:hypothetical protein
MARAYNHSGTGCRKCRISALFAIDGRDNAAIQLSTLICRMVPLVADAAAGRSKPRRGSCDSPLFFLLSSQHQRWPCRRPASIRTTPSISGGSVTFSLQRNLSAAVSPTGTIWVTMNGGLSRGRREHALIRYTSAPNGTMCPRRQSLMISATAGQSRIWCTGRWRKSGTPQSGMTMIRSLTSKSTVLYQEQCIEVGAVRSLTAQTAHISTAATTAMRSIII